MNTRDGRIFGFEMVHKGKYSTGEIDSQWNDDIKTESLQWLEKHPELSNMTRAELDKVMSKEHGMLNIFS